MVVDDVRNAVLNPDLITQLYELEINNKWGKVNGRQFLIDVFMLCEHNRELEEKVKKI